VLVLIRDLGKRGPGEQFGKIAMHLCDGVRHELYEGLSNLF
jgi:hypothetical protein